MIIIVFSRHHTRSLPAAHSRWTTGYAKRGVAESVPVVDMDRGKRFCTEGRGSLCISLSVFTHTHI